MGTRVHSWHWTDGDDLDEIPAKSKTMGMDGKGCIDVYLSINVRSILTMYCTYEIKEKKSQIKCICNCINKDHKHSATIHFFPFHLYMYMDVIILKYTSLRLNIRPVDGWIFVEVFYFRYCHVVIILFTMLGYATGQRKITWQIVINIFVSLLSTGKWKKKNDNSSNFSHILTN